MARAVREVSKADLMARGGASMLTLTLSKMTRGLEEAEQGQRLAPMGPQLAVCASGSPVDR